MSFERTESEIVWEGRIATVRRERWHEADIQIVPWPLERLDDAIAECRDSKSLIGLMWLREELSRPATA